MHTAVVLFTRDLRVHDNPALASTIAAAERVVPLYVLDPAIRAAANRHRFLAEGLADLRESLRRIGGDLVIRTGDPVRQAISVAREVGAEGIALAGDVSRYARSRERRLAEECERHRIALKVFPGLTVVAPGDLRPGGGGPAYQIFTPYWRSWSGTIWREPSPTPRKITLPAGLTAGDLPSPPVHGLSGTASHGGEAEGRRRLAAWLTDISGYERNHDLMAVDRTSRLSPYLRFGCLSPLEVARRAQPVTGSEPFVRQLCWRDFYYQVAAAYPKINKEALRPGREDWRDEADALDAWREGRTGVPIVDAGMRQMHAEGWMHNRARLLTASFLTKHLRLDWRAGAAHFFDWLLDGDIPNNYGNWQWVAGTGNDTKPYRGFNPVRQALRYDPGGDYVRRHLPELSAVPGAAVHEPWRLPPALRRTLDYPRPLDGGQADVVWLRP